MEIESKAFLDDLEKIQVLLYKKDWRVVAPLLDSFAQKYHNPVGYQLAYANSSKLSDANVFDALLENYDKLFTPINFVRMLSIYCHMDEDSLVHLLTECGADLIPLNLMMDIVDDITPDPTNEMMITLSRILALFCSHEAILVQLVAEDSQIDELLTILNHFQSNEAVIPPLLLAYANAFSLVEESKDYFVKSGGAKLVLDCVTNPLNTKCALYLIRNLSNTAHVQKKFSKEIVKVATNVLMNTTDDTSLLLNATWILINLVTTNASTKQLIGERNLIPHIVANLLSMTDLDLLEANCILIQLLTKLRRNRAIFHDNDVIQVLSSLLQQYTNEEIARPIVRTLCYLTVDDHGITALIDSNILTYVIPLLKTSSSFVLHQSISLLFMQLIRDPKNKEVIRELGGLSALNASKDRFSNSFVHQSALDRTISAIFNDSDSDNSSDASGSSDEFKLDDEMDEMDELDDLVASLEDLPGKPVVQPHAIKFPDVPILRPITLPPRANSPVSPRVSSPVSPRKHSDSPLRSPRDFRKSPRHSPSRVYRHEDVAEDAKLIDMIEERIRKELAEMEELNKKDDKVAKQSDDKLDEALDDIVNNLTGLDDEMDQLGASIEAMANDIDSMEPQAEPHASDDHVDKVEEPLEEPKQALVEPTPDSNDHVEKVEEPIEEPKHDSKDTVEQVEEPQVEEPKQALVEPTHASNDHAEKVEEPIEDPKQALVEPTHASNDHVEKVEEPIEDPTHTPNERVEQVEEPLQVAKQALVELIHASNDNVKQVEEPLEDPKQALVELIHASNDRVEMVEEPLEEPKQTLEPITKKEVKEPNRTLNVVDRKEVTSQDRLYFAVLAVFMVFIAVAALQ